MQGIDYHDTYSPVVSMTCLQLIICYGLKFNFFIRKIDFVAAYLNGELTDVDIYMVLLPGFEDRYRKSPRSACHLKKALYGPKQSGREWFAKNEKSCLRRKEFAPSGSHAFTVPLTSRTGAGTHGSTPRICSSQISSYCN